MREKEVKRLKRETTRSKVIPELLQRAERALDATRLNWPITSFPGVGKSAENSTAIATTRAGDWFPRYFREKNFCPLPPPGEIEPGRKMKKVSLRRSHVSRITAPTCAIYLGRYVSILRLRRKAKRARKTVQRGACVKWYKAQQTGPKCGNDARQWSTRDSAADTRQDYTPDYAIPFDEWRRSGVVTKLPFSLIEK